MNLEALNVAKEYKKRAYVPYSKFHVGCALVTSKGIIGGCNIENASFAATICAERTALAKAYSEQDVEIEEIYIVGDSEFTYPCGICRQVIAELAPNAKIFICSDESCKEYSVSDILPFAFGKEDLK